MNPCVRQALPISLRISWLDDGELNGGFEWSSAITDPATKANYENQKHTTTNQKGMKTVLPIIPLSAALLVLSLAASKPSRADSDKQVEHLKIAEGQIVSELIGQAISSPTGGIIFGYYTYIKGLDTLFANAPEDESTALFTFFRDTTNLRVTGNGPLLILSREGTTTVYLNAAPGGNFSNPDSFRAGAPIQTSVLRFQAVIDTVAQTAAVVIEDTITSSSVFSVDERKYQIGRVGDVIRTTQQVHLNAPGSEPSAFFGGYSVGAEKSENSHKD